MYYVYVLKSKKDNMLYTGCTRDLKKRFVEHSKGLVTSTKKRIPFEIIFYEAFSNKEEAFTRERWLKTGWGRNHLKKILFNSVKI